MPLFSVMFYLVWAVSKSAFRNAVN